MKLLLRGSSIAAGHGVTRGYADILAGYCASHDIEFINRSRYRETSFNAIWSFYEDIDPLKPDILLMHYGVDDAFHPVYRSEFKENLVNIVRLARKRFNPEIMIATSQTFENPYDMDAVYIYYRTIREVCLDLDCEMISVHSYWAGKILDEGLKPSDLLQKDDRYPNEKGHEIIAEAIINRLPGISSAWSR